MLRNRGPAFAVVVLLALPIVGATYARLSLHQDDSTSYHKAAGTTEKETPQDIATETIAHYTEMLAWLTGLMVIATGLLWKTTRDSVNVTRGALNLATAEFNATHRPKLVIRAIALTEFNPSKLTVISFVIANAGEAEGTITEGNATIYVARTGDLPPLPSYDTDRLWLLQSRFPPGRSNQVYKQSEVPLQEWEYDCVYNMGFGKIYLFGYLRYSHGAGNSRQFGFCRVYDIIQKRFVTVNDPNYEYSD